MPKFNWLPPLDDYPTEKDLTHGVCELAQDELGTRNLVIHLGTKDEQEALERAGLIFDVLNAAWGSDESP